MLRWMICVVLVVSSQGLAGDFASSTHFFSILSRTDGQAGTRWTTRVSVYNPQAEALVITARLSMAGAVDERSLNLPANATFAWADFLGEVFAAEGNGAILLEADEATNPGLSSDCRAFVASMRISTTGDEGGSYGQGVASADPVSGFLGDWVAYLPGARSEGTPGVDGFRSNVGLWNIGSEDVTLRLRLLDPTGQVVWEQRVTAERHRPRVLALPRDLGIAAGTVVVDSEGEWADCAVYLSVVDNLSGDATYLSPQILSPEAASSCGISVVQSLGAPSYREADRAAATTALRARFLQE